MSDSSTNGVSPDGRDRVTGRFGPGNLISKGNAVALRTRELRQAIFDAVDAGAVQAVIRKLAALARKPCMPLLEL
jgi:hypothetical protein